MAKNIFIQQKSSSPKPNRNNFDLSNQCHGTYKMGIPYPIFCLETNPGDSFRIKTDFGLKFMPMPFPVQSRMRAAVHVYKVRNKNLWDRWQDWISMHVPEDKANTPEYTPPYIVQDKSFFRTGSLADHLDIPTTMVSSSDLQLTTTLHTYNEQYPSPNYPQLFWTFSNVFPCQWSDSYQSPYRTDVSTYDLLRGNAGSYGFIAFDIPLERIDPDSSSVDITGLPDGDYFFIFSHRSNRSNDWHNATTIHSSWSMDGQFATATNGTIKFPVNWSYLSNSMVGSGTWTVFLIGQELLQYVGLSYSAADKSQVPFSEVAFSSYSSNDGVIDLSNGNSTNVFTDQTNGVRLSALPFRAYESICNVYYRDERVDPFTINGVPEYNKYITNNKGGADTTKYSLYQRNWEADFLTSCTSSPQQGAAPLVGMSVLGNITLTDESGTTTARAIVGENGEDIVGVEVTSPVANGTHAQTLRDIASVGMSINDFRQVNAFQRFLEASIRKGYKYIDFVESHTGVRPQYKELDMPEFIGGFVRDVQVNSISETTSSGESILGDYAGQANCFGGSNHTINTYCDDYGFIIGIMTIYPDPSYSQLLPKHFLHRSPLDYHFPEFNKLGMQPITYEEVCPVECYADGKSLTDTFGYQRPNYHLVSNYDKVHGQFRTTLKDYLISRIFAGRPELGHDFIKIDPDECNNIFAVTQADNDVIVGQIVNQIYAKRAIPRVVIPSLE